jgi:hypothetical protein
MKMRGLALISVAVGGLSLAVAAVVTPVRQACAQRGQMSFAEDGLGFFRAPRTIDESTSAFAGSHLC